MNDLVEKARAGDAEAFSELIRQNMQSMYKAAIAILRSDEDAADAIQSTILKCWEGLSRLREPKYFKTWLTKILINTCNDMLRDRQRLQPDGEIEITAARDDSYLNIEWKQTLESIDEKYRLILLLYYSDGYNTAEIGKILGIPEATVRTRLARGRKKYLETVKGE
ncbi:MAG: sigma-70 family RNA polymerase sigma factor [Clostridiales bacterium]|nr:sigma-70 family RNA polymerase sigma factor [Clostridiales bacterium]